MGRQGASLSPGRHCAAGRTFSGPVGAARAVPVETGRLATLRAIQLAQKIPACHSRLRSHHSPSVPRSGTPCSEPADPASSQGSRRSQGPKPAWTWPALALAPTKWLAWLCPSPQPAPSPVLVLPACSLSLWALTRRLLCAPRGPRRLRSHPGEFPAGGPRLPPGAQQRRSGPGSGLPSQAAGEEKHQGVGPLQHEGARSLSAPGQGWSPRGSDPPGPARGAPGLRLGQPRSRAARSR